MTSAPTLKNCRSVTKLRSRLYPTHREGEALRPDEIYVECRLPMPSKFNCCTPPPPTASLPTSTVVLKSTLAHPLHHSITPCIGATSGSTLGVTSGASCYHKRDKVYHIVIIPPLQVCTRTTVSSHTVKTTHKQKHAQFCFCISSRHRPSATTPG